VTPRSLPLVEEAGFTYRILQWGLRNSLWVFPMGTSCCAIELMSAAASRVDLDRMGTIVRATPRQADVMVVAGTITVKMAPRVRALWDQMPEPKWALAMGSCAISGDFYRNLYSVVPGVDTIIPVDVYVPGCPPNPEALMHGLLRLQEKIRDHRAGKARVRDPSRCAEQEQAALVATSLERDDEAAPAPALVPAPEPAPASALPPTSAPASAPVIGVAQHVDLARRLRSQGYTQLVYVVATHFPAKTGAKPQPERFELAYALRTPGRGSSLAAWRLELAPEQAAPSLAGVFAGADWQEREQYDLLGVRFDGHPDMRRILLPDAWSGHPLRKDYASDTACPPWR
jgi:NADH-quinone oxidoreductase B subunit